jgi:hypothetical protein
MADMQYEFSDADHERAVRAGKQAMAKTAGEAAKGKTVKLPGLGVRVRDGGVYVNEAFGKRLGDLAGAHAEITDGTRPHRVGTAIVAGAVWLPAALVGLSRGFKASAFVVFADGTVRETKLGNKAAAGKAQGDVVRFNALAAAAGTRQDSV